MPQQPTPQRRSIWPSVKTRVEEQRRKEAEQAQLWEPRIKGREISARNLKQDAGALAETVRNDPGKFVSTLRERLKSYVDRGPDITKPVPLTKKRYRNPPD